MNGKRTRVFKSQWQTKKDKSKKLMFPRVEGNCYARVMREKVKPLLRARKESSIDVKRCLHGINLNRVRTHSFRLGSVSYMKRKHGSSKLVGAVAGMTAKRVDTDYDEVTPARVLEAQKILEPFLQAVRCRQIETRSPNHSTCTKLETKKKKKAKTKKQRSYNNDAVEPPREVQAQQPLKRKGAKTQPKTVLAACQPSAARLCVRKISPFGSMNHGGIKATLPEL